MEEKIESKSNDDIPSKRTLVEKVQDFCTSRDIDLDFERFAKEHSQIFLPSINLKKGDEHPIEFHDIYRLYVDEFGEKIENFILEQGEELIDFYKQAQDALEEEQLGSKKFFLEALLATSEYEHFYMMMRSEMVMISMAAASSKK